MRKTGGEWENSEKQKQRRRRESYIEVKFLKLQVAIDNNSNYKTAILNFYVKGGTKIIF